MLSVDKMVESSAAASADCSDQKSAESLVAPMAEMMVARMAVHLVEWLEHLLAAL